MLCVISVPPDLLLCCLCPTEHLDRSGVNRTLCFHHLAAQSASCISELCYTIPVQAAEDLSVNLAPELCCMSSPLFFHCIPEWHDVHWSENALKFLKGKTQIYKKNFTLPGLHILALNVYLVCYFFAFSDHLDCWMFVFWHNCLW